MNNRLVLAFILALSAMPLMAQPPIMSARPIMGEGNVEAEGGRPVRTPEEEALKQTENLQRELNLTAEQREAVYAIHLKYALLRRESNTRQEALQRMNDMTTELLAVMTHDQQQAFLNKQLDFEPRRAYKNVPRICHDSI